MKHFGFLFCVASLICFFSTTSAKAQILPSADTTKAAVSYVPSSQAACLQVFDEKADRQYRMGKNLLIAGGALTASGVALYTSAWLCMGEGGPLPTTLALSGITCAGLSVGCYIAGSVLYCKGKKNRVVPAPGGIALQF